MVKFREHVTKSGNLVFGGKNAKNNEELIKQIKPNEDVFHTAEPGSPFVNIKEKAKRGSVKEAAVFCAAHSKDWKKSKDKVTIHHFKGKDIHKKKAMKLGTFGIKKHKIIKVRRRDILKFLEDKK